MRHRTRHGGDRRATGIGMLLVALLANGLGGGIANAADPAYVQIPATTFTSVLATEAAATPVAIPAYAMRTEPVTNAQYLAFVTAHPEWRRDRTPSVFAEKRYLAQWQASDRLGDGALPDQPVTQVSWFAAQAFCASEHARLPSWIEWERAASASATVADARSDPAWRQRLLDWYARPSREALPSIGGAPNLFGVRDLHALVWEWTDDFNALMVTSDSRDQGDPDRLKFCGEGALSLRDRDNYALLMRIAMLSSLKAADTTANLGFRCVRDPGSMTAFRFLFAGLLTAFALLLCTPVQSHAATPTAWPSDSVYHLDAALLDQDGHSLPFASTAGRPRLVTMFYTSCKFVCPLIIDTLRKTENELSTDERAGLDVLMVSFDPVIDTPAVLKSVADKHHLDTPRWRLARAAAPDVRRIAAVLGIQYRQLQNHEFSHSSVLVLLDAQGRIVARSERLGEPDPELVAAIKRVLAPAR